MNRIICWYCGKFAHHLRWEAGQWPPGSWEGRNHWHCYGCSATVPCSERDGETPIGLLAKKDLRDGQRAVADALNGVRERHCLSWIELRRAVAAEMEVPVKAVVPWMFTLEQCRAALAAVGKVGRKAS